MREAKAVADLEALKNSGGHHDGGAANQRLSERLACENAALRGLVVELTTEVEKYKVMVASLQVALEKVWGGIILVYIHYHWLYQIHNPPRQIVKERLQVGELEVVLDLEKDVAVSTAGVPA